MDLIDYQDLNLISLWVGSYPLNFLNVYIDPETRNSMRYLDDVKDRIPSLYLIAGDFNAPSYHFDTLLPDVNNPNARQIIDWASNFGLSRNALWIHSYTHFPDNGNRLSVLDLAFSDPDDDITVKVL